MSDVGLRDELECYALLMPLGDQLSVRRRMGQNSDPGFLGR